MRPVVFLLAAVALSGCGSGEGGGASPTATPTQAVQEPLSFTDPVDVAFDRSGRAWVADYKGDALLRVEELAAEAAPREEVAVDGGPNRIAVDHDGRFWLALYDDSALASIAPGEDARPARSKVKAPSRPTGLEFGPDGRLWVTSQDNARLVGYTKQQLRTGKGAPELVRLPGGVAAVNEDVAFDEDGRAYVAQYETGKVLVFDRLASGARPSREVRVGFGPIGLEAAQHGSVWVSAYTGGRLVELRDGGRQQRTVRLADATAPHSVTFDEGGSAWVTDPAAFVLTYDRAALRKATAKRRVP